MIKRPGLAAWAFGMGHIALGHYSMSIQENCFVVNASSYNFDYPLYHIRNGRLMYRDQPIADYTARIIGIIGKDVMLAVAYRRSGLRAILTIPRKQFDCGYRLARRLNRESAQDTSYPRMGEHLRRAILAASGVSI